MTTPIDKLKGESGFGLIELLIAMVVLQVGLMAVVGAFSAGAVSLAKASHINTAAVLADQQMELYRAMPYDAIGLDYANAPTSGNYISDTAVCATGQATTCNDTGPRNNSNPNTGAWSCTASSGSTSVSLYFSANGVNPCAAERTVPKASSPDGNTYIVETYITWGSLTSNARSSKQVAVVVRDGKTNRELAKEITSFDCSTGTPTNGTC